MWGVNPVSAPSVRRALSLLLSENNNDDDDEVGICDAAASVVYLLEDCRRENLQHCEELKINMKKNKIVLM
jgi:hypothetical protein